MGNTGRTAAALLAFMIAAPLAGRADDLTRVAVSDMLSKLPPGQVIDLAGRSLRGLDLSRLDFTGGDLHGADLSGASLLAAKFQDANLTGANLSGAQMGITDVIHANLTDANLSGARMFGLVTSSGMETSSKEAPILVRANMSGATVVVRARRHPRPSGRGRRLAVVRLGAGSGGPERRPVGVADQAASTGQA